MHKQKNKKDWQINTSTYPAVSLETADTLSYRFVFEEICVLEYYLVINAGFPLFLCWVMWQEGASVQTVSVFFTPWFSNDLIVVETTTKIVIITIDII